jgi:hypothetical protein
MSDRLPTLVTPDARAGLALAGKLAGELRAQFDDANSRVERLGGMNSLLPAPVPQEIIVGILFYAIAAANEGWVKARDEGRAFRREDVGA